MMLDMLAAIARKDYEDRRRQAEGINKAKAQGKYRGRVADAQKHELSLAHGKSLRETAHLGRCIQDDGNSRLQQRRRVKKGAAPPGTVPL